MCILLILTPDYLPAVLVPLAYILRKLYARTKIIPLHEIDLQTGARTVHNIADEPDEAPKGWGGAIHRALF